MRQTEEEGGKERWQWLSGTGIKRETESLIMAAQEQATRTNVIKARIDRTQEENKCRICGRVYIYIYIYKYINIINHVIK